MTAWWRFAVVVLAVAATLEWSPSGSSGELGGAQLGTPAAAAPRGRSSRKSKRKRPKASPDAGVPAERPPLDAGAPAPVAPSEPAPVEPPAVEAPPAPAAAAPAPAPSPRREPSVAPPPVVEVVPAARHGGFVDAMDCSACHSPEGWKLAAAAGRSGFDHERTGFPLRGAHAQTMCTGCHEGQGAVPTTCEGCHRDPHQSRMDGGCAECHRATAWSDTDALTRHRSTRMPLTGRHAMIECTACHQRQRERTWTDLPVECYGCHRADYSRPGVHPDHDGDPADPTQRPLPRECSQCHRTTTWRDALIVPGGALARLAMEPWDHDPMFQLSTGPHRDAPCTSCHSNRRRPRATRCDGCHQPAALASQHRGASLSRLGCLQCHPRGTRR